MTELYPATGWLKRAQEVLDGTATFSASDLPKDLPEPERVIPLPDQSEPGEDEDEPAPPVPNAQIQGDDLGPDAA